MLKKILCAALSVMLILPFGAIGANAADGDYTIVSPYEDVIWEGENAWGAYKGTLHSHTTYSDADDTLPVMVKEAYRQDYDFLAIADHGITGVDWDQAPAIQLLYTYQLLIDNPYEHLTTEEYEDIKNGTYENRGKIMVPVLGANELNYIALTKNHVNGFFCGYGQGILGQEEDYETVIAGTHAAGGITFINHPGDFIAANKENGRAEDYNQLKIFIDPLMKYDSCVGIEIFNLRDTTDRADRILWDTILQYTIPQGKVVWGFANDDSHALDDIDVTRDIMLMPALSNEDLRTAMENGTFFACSRYARYEMGYACAVSVVLLVIIWVNGGK